MLHRAGLDAIADNGTVSFGAIATLDAVTAAGVRPLAAAAGAVADLEIRAQATIGGNLCASPGAQAPRGDLQAPLVAMGARVRSAGPGGERTESVEEYLAGGRDRLVLSIEQALADGASPADAGARATEGVQPQGDALASAWYRREVLPVLVGRVIERLQGG